MCEEGLHREIEVAGHYASEDQLDVVVVGWCGRPNLNPLRCSVGLEPSVSPRAGNDFGYLTLDFMYR